MRPPEARNIHTLYWLSVTSQGKDEAIEATTAPMPSDTNVIGMAQQSRVPDVVNSRSQLQVFGRVFVLAISVHHSDTKVNEIAIFFIIVVDHFQLVLGSEDNVSFEVDEYGAAEQTLAAR